MAQPDPEAYGWLAALCIGLVAALSKVIGKLVRKSEDTLAIVLRRDLDALEHSFEKAQAEKEDLQRRVNCMNTEIKVLKARLGINGQSQR